MAAVWIKIIHGQVWVIGDMFFMVYPTSQASSSHILVRGQNIDGSVPRRLHTFLYRSIDKVVSGSLKVSPIVSSSI
jgi:hypothetical protein